jgi:hypothetical protein
MGFEREGMNQQQCWQELDNIIFYQACCLSSDLWRYKTKAVARLRRTGITTSDSR